MDFNMAEMAGWLTAEPREAKHCTRPNMRPYFAATNHFPPMYPAPTKPKLDPIARTTCARARVPKLVVAAYRKAPAVTRATPMVIKGRVPKRSSREPEKNWQSAKAHV